jgi:DNA-binding NtrC family response regulator
MKSKILLIDDDNIIIETVGEFLRLKHFLVYSETKGFEGLKKFESEDFPIVICDYMLPDINGLELFKKMLTIKKDCILILITGHGSIEGAVAAIKLGVFDYITKPINLKHLEITIEKALKVLSLKRENIKLKQQLQLYSKTKEIVGNSKPITKIKDLIQRIAPTNATVLITGESGTGKELVAKSVHNQSNRKDKPFIAIDCGAIPENLLEDELFGHVKGAFTDANKDRQGKFQAANNGTIFLDEIGNMSLQLQTKLLRVIQEKEITPIGSSKIISIDVRIIAATNLDLKKQIKKGLFREDLYYRLNVIPIHIPPLRERKNDIPKLIDHFNEVSSFRNTMPKVTFSKEVLAILINYKWPGNIRELENTIERLVILQPEDGEIKPENLPEELKISNNYDIIKSIEPGFNLDEVIKNIERKYIEDALNISGGIKAKAAKILGLKRTTLVQKIKKLNIATDKEMIL